MAADISSTPCRADQLPINHTDVQGFPAQRASFGVERGPGQQRKGTLRHRSSPPGMHNMFFIRLPNSRDPCSSAEVDPAAASVYSSSRGPESLENLPIQGS